MAINAEQLNIILSARDKEFTKAMKANEARVERLSKRSGKSLKQMEGSFGSLGKAARLLAPIIASVFTVRAIGRMVDSAAAIKDLAGIAGVGVVEFQRLTVASRTVGIQQEKLSDIIKDVNDKFGDFMATGAGPLADFFENVAPQVGVTAEEFKNLSGPQALQLYVKSLEKANLSQAEMTFYMEAIASDSTALIPLLRDNGAEMKRLGDEAQRTGRILDKDAVDGAKSLQTEFDNLRDSMGTAIQSGLLDNADEIMAIVKVFTDEILPKVISGVSALISLMGGGAGAEPSAEDQERFAADAAAAGELGGGDASTTGTWFFDPTTGNFVDLANQSDADFNAMMDRIESGARPPGMAGPSNAPMPPLRPNVPSSSSGSHGDSGASDAADRILDGLIDQYDNLRRSLDPVLDAQMEFEENQDIINALVEAGKIKKEQGTEVLNRYAQAMSDASLESSELASAMDGIQSSMESAFMSMVDGTATAQDAFRAMARDIISELYRVLVVQRLVGSFSADGGGVLGAAFGAFSGRASGGPVSAGQPYVVGEHGRELFVPQSAGRVLSVPQTKGAMGGGGGVIVQQTINVTTGVQQTVRAEVMGLMPQIAEASKSAVLDARKRGGSFAAAFT